MLVYRVLSPTFNDHGQQSIVILNVKINSLEFADKMQMNGKNILSILISSWNILTDTEEYFIPRSHHHPLLREREREKGIHFNWFLISNQYLTFDDHHKK